MSSSQDYPKIHDRPVAGAFFVTLGVKEGDFLFGDIVEHQIELNEVGKMVQRIWLGLPDTYTTLSLDKFIVMPNHFHAIFFIDNTPIKTPDSTTAHPLTVGEIIAVLKAHTDDAYLEGLRKMGWNMYNFHLWERSYFDRPLRTLSEVQYARSYIDQNPLHWHRDMENPDFQGWGRELQE